MIVSKWLTPQIIRILTMSPDYYDGQMGWLITIHGIQIQWYDLIE